MYSSQTQKGFLNKTWKKAIVVFSVVLIWQYFSLTSAALAQSYNSIPSSIIDHHPISTEQTIKQQNKAKFLEIIDTDEKINYNSADLTCLAKNIYYEASNQSKLGKMAVAQVTLNRIKNPKFSKSICGVVLEPNQFSWVNNHNRKVIPVGDQWKESLEVAHQVIEGRRIYGMEHALYFHNDSIHPNWKHLCRLTQIGAHIFYTDRI